jgi:hypothetical protein
MRDTAFKRVMGKASPGLEVSWRGRAVHSYCIARWKGLRCFWRAGSGSRHS